MRWLWAHTAWAGPSGRESVSMTGRLGLIHLSGGRNGGQMVSMGLWLQNTSLVEATSRLSLLCRVTQNPHLTPDIQLSPGQITVSGEKEHRVL